MSTMAQVEENLASAGRSGANILSAEEVSALDVARETYNSQFAVHCTECRYCMPCPNGVDIPTNFTMFNRGIGMAALQQSRMRYGAFDKSMLASACIECRVCEDKCPQHIVIGDWMPIIDDVLGKGKDYDPTLAPAH
jgi:predicted aldo/keto reductase-like oxidoreductase